jgi:hypothetical protein
MKSRKITKDEINRITKKCSTREKAIFTIMRQSGLLPIRIKQLRIENVERILEPEPPVPCKINVSHEKYPAFIGQEAINYLKEYLDKRARREKLTSESLLFTARNNPNKEIDTKSVSRAFKANVGKSSELELRSLIGFYKTNTKNYQDELKELGKGSTPKDDEFYRRLYRKKAIQNLETEPLTLTDVLHRLETQNKELAQRITEIEDKLLPIESEISAEATGETRFEWFERWLREHPEEKKRLEEQQQEQQKSYFEYLEICPEAKKIDPQIDAKIKQLQKFYTEHLDYTVWELRNKLKELTDITKKHKKTQRKHVKH